MAEPKQPDDHPTEEATPTDPHGHAPNGVPHEADDGEAKELPNSDRAKTENAAKG